MSNSPPTTRLPGQDRDGTTRAPHILLAIVGPAEINPIVARMQPLLINLPAEIREVSGYAGSRRNQDDFTFSPLSEDTCATKSNEVEASLWQYWACTDILNIWADLLVLIVADADFMARMLYGMTDNPVLSLLRGWDVSKKILFVPGMSTAMWEHPTTKKHINKIRRKWNWVRVFQPILWDFVDYSSGARKRVKWDGSDELFGALKNELDLMMIGQDVDVAMGMSPISYCGQKRNSISLPPEIWGMIFERLGDWEIAQALGVLTNLPKPSDWQKPPRHDAAANTMIKIEWIILTGTCLDLARKLEDGPVPKWLSGLCVKLIMKFNATDILSYLEKNHYDLFWATFGHTLLPTKASAVFGKVPILEWWRTSPSFLSREYNNEALDGASQAGFVHVLDWWKKSGLPLRYSEAALEQASSKGKIEVLEWWKNAGSYSGGYQTESDAILPAGTHKPLQLKVGKSVCFAAQNGQTETVRWWDQSGIPYSHEESVARLASANGHVDVLRLWKEIKGEKMIYDNQVLVGPTKNGHWDVLEWWKTSGFRVEYRPCDIEEALEDSLGGVGEEQVKSWWARNGLNLGVGTSEWMQVKVL